MAEFNQGAFYKAVLDIEKYLGWLKGNELAYEYWESVREANRYTDEFPQELYPRHGLGDWKTPCPDGQYSFTPDGGGLEFQMAFNASEGEVESVRQEIKSNLDQAWNNGATWTEGMYEYINDVSRQFVKPDVPVMAGAVNAMATKVVNELSFELNDDWAGLQYLLDDWSGQGAGAFTEFYSNFNDVLARFGLMSGHIAAGFAMSTRIINGYQQAVWEFVDSVRQGLKDNLGFWVEVKGPLPAPYDFPGWIADAGKIVGPVYDVIKIIPGVSVVTDPIDNAITVASSAKSLIELLPEGKETTVSYDFSAQTAEGMYDEITTKLHDDFYTKYQDALDQVNSPTGAVDPDAADNVGFSASGVEAQMVELQGALDQWELPVVPPGSLAGEGDTYP